MSTWKSIDSLPFSLCLTLFLLLGSFPLQIGLITAVLIGLQSSKALTSKRTEFFRETSSGYNPNAYFLAINIVSTLEAMIQIVLVAFVAAFLREPVASWAVFFVHFLVLVSFFAESTTFGDFLFQLLTQLFVQRIGMGMCFMGTLLPYGCAGRKRDNSGTSFQTEAPSCLVSCFLDLIVSFVVSIS